MDEARRIALKHAVWLTPSNAETPFDADKVVAAAEKFHAFLTGPSQRPVSDALEYVKDLAAELPPPIPPTYDLGKGDQTPTLGNNAPASSMPRSYFQRANPFSIGTEGKQMANPGNWLANDHGNQCANTDLENVKTRLVRQGG